jgi:hypothetical protein
MDMPVPGSEVDVVGVSVVVVPWVEVVYEEVVDELEVVVVVVEDDVRK